MILRDFLKSSLLRAVALAALVATLAGCAVLVPLPQTEPVSDAAALAAYARVLVRFVNDKGEVDFAALAQDGRDLDLYVRHVADTPLAGLDGRGRKLAHLINSYNALSMYNVVRAGIPTTHAGLAKIRFFINRKLVVGGERISLYDLENIVIRPLGEPRVHFALNCMAVSCPVLPRKPFTATGLEAELERETRAFFARPENFRADPAAHTVHLNEVLSFYTEDFVPAHARNVLEYANRYAPAAAPAHYAARFTPYDWTVANSRRGR